MSSWQITPAWALIVLLAIGLFMAAFTFRYDCRPERSTGYTPWDLNPKVVCIDRWTGEQKSRR